MARQNLKGEDKLIFDLLLDRYPRAEFVAFFNNGSTARVYHVQLPVGPDLDLKIDRIIKVFRHDSDLATVMTPEEVFRNEIRNLIAISHSNITALYAAGFLEHPSGQRIPFYEMEYLPGAKDLDVWLQYNPDEITRELLLDLLLQALRGIDALHGQNIIHCDIKFGNLLVGDGGRLKVTDLGFSKTVRPGTDKTALYTTHRPFPARYREHEKRLEDKNMMLVDLPLDLLNQSFDLHYFSWVLRDLLNKPEIRPVLTTVDRRDLGLMATRLDIDDTPPIPRYSSARRVIADLERLKGLHSSRAGVGELSTYTGTRTIRIPVSGSIPFSARVQSVISHPTFLRLHNALQLGFTYLVFPGATHTRFEHSLGVFYNVARYINSMLADDHQSFFRQLVDEERIATTLLAGLIHDLGQHSFAHGLEDFALAKSHEAVALSFISGEGLDGLVRSALFREPLVDVIQRNWPEVDIDMLCWLIADVKRRGATTDLGWEVMKSIINGPLDADKTDYLLRDAHHAGVEYARSIDITRFMNSLTASVIRQGTYSEGALAITWKGAQSAENIILARSQMFWVLYWHHAIRSAHAMLAHAAAAHLRQSGPSERLAFSDVLYCGTIGEFLAHLQESPAGRARELASWLRVRRLYKRGISLDYIEKPNLYQGLLDLKNRSEKDGDPLLLKVSEGLAEVMNERLAEAGKRTRLKKHDVIVDIPREGKDKLGSIYVVEKHNAAATPYRSRGLAGSEEDWQNRVRTVRIFVNPKVTREERQILREHGREILESVA